MILLNWKANGNRKLIDELKHFAVKNHIVVMPPHCLLGMNWGNIQIGGQCVSEFENGARTGEVTAQMLAELGVKFCLVGHSERRKLQNKNNDILIKQIENLLKFEIIPVLCVGESLEERKAGKCFDILTNQLSVCKNACIVAYEPVWAIGTGIVPKIEEIVEVKNFIKEKLVSVKILYGGSVTSANIAEILAAGVDGALVGGASLKIEEVVKFNKIINKNYGG